MSNFNPFEELTESFALDRDAQFSIDRPANQNGDWWLDLSLGEYKTSVLWRERFGFGVFVGETHYGDRPNEVFSSTEKVSLRLRQLASRQAKNQSASALGLKDLRQLVGESQAKIAAALKKEQSEVSRFETREDVHLAYLRSYIEALGGELEISVKFPDFQGPLTLGKAGPIAKGPKKHVV